MKLKLTLLSISIMLSIFEGISCEQPHRLINENRIWEYSIYGSHLRYGFYFKMKFDGMKTINGRDYHIFKTFDQTGHNPENDETWKVDAPGKDFYLREEDNCVYSAYPCNWPYPDDGKESLVYDFNKFDDNLITIGHEDGTICEASISKKGTFEIEGIECGYYLLTVLEQPSKPDTYIDGIGRLYNGCLPWFNSTAVTGYIFGCDKHPVLPAPLSFDTYLERVTDLEGNVIFDINATLGIKTPNAEGVSLSAEGGMLRYADIVPGTEIRIIDISGATVLSCRSDAESGTADISRLPRGLYIATAGSASLKFTR